jgi:hypothetical protein
MPPVQDGGSLAGNDSATASSIRASSSNLEPVVSLMGAAITRLPVGAEVPRRFLLDETILTTPYRADGKVWEYTKSEEWLLAAASG